MDPTKARLIATLRLAVVVTIVLWGIPLLLIPQSWAADWGLRFSEPIFYTRLAGVFAIALSIAYAAGLRKLMSRGAYEWVLDVGLVANAGLGVLILQFFLDAGFETMSLIMRSYLYTSATAAFFIALGLYFFGYRIVRGRT